MVSGFLRFTNICKDLIINSLKAAGMAKAVEKANEVFHRIKNRFIVYRSEQN